MRNEPRHSSTNESGPVCCSPASHLCPDSDSLVVTMVWETLVVVAVSLARVGANLRCYSCAPCNELDYYSSWTDLTRWELTVIKYFPYHEIFSVS